MPFTKNRLMGFMSISILLSTVANANERISEIWRIELPKKTFSQYEPIPIEFTIILDESVDEKEAVQWLSVNRRNLSTVQLRDLEDEVVLETTLFAVRIEQNIVKSTDYYSNGLAFLNMKFGRSGTESQEVPAGEYQLVVTERRGEQNSNTVRITVREDQGDDLKAGQLFKESFPEAGLFLLENKDFPKVRDNFLKLAGQFPETVYGQYAAASLAIMKLKDTFEVHNNKGGATVWNPVVQELQKAAKYFNSGNMIREMVLYNLSRAQAVAGNYKNAKATVELLEKEFPHGKYGRQAGKMKQELEKIQKKEQ